MNDKPSWEDAPEWAQWLAMDADGDWYWYEGEPVKTRRGWVTSSGYVIAANTGWTKTREQRP